MYVYIYIYKYIYIMCVYSYNGCFPCVTSSLLCAAITIITESLTLSLLGPSTPQSICHAGLFLTRLPRSQLLVFLQSILSAIFLVFFTVNKK
uniref:Uncharacterized protein n=1 Tax=Octopus bimaculoides TaxID=37653 RepID=A0A0L8FLM9_OCTBM